MTTRRDVKRKVEGLETVEDGGYSFVKLLSTDDEGHDIYEVLRETEDGYLVHDRHDGVHFYADKTPDEALQSMLSDGVDTGGGTV
jgi:hypothetical protein